MIRLRELYGNISQRVLLLPVFAGMALVAIKTCISLSFAISIMSLLIIALFCLCRKSGKQMMSAVLTLCVCTFLVIYFIEYRSHSVPSLYDDMNVECKVHSVGHTLDGTYKIRAFSYDYGFLEFRSPDGLIPVSGEHILVHGFFYEPYTPRNPGQFDQKQYLTRIGVEYAFYAESAELLKEASLLNRCISHIDSIMYDIRIRIMQLYGDDAPLAASIFLGDSSLTEDNVRSLYKRNGCSHLLAVSGTHFAGFLAIVTYFLDQGKKNRAKVTVYIVFCIILASFTGWSSSVTRACVMCCASYCSKDGLSGLCISCIVMMLADPYNALSYGFLMTCSASLGIMYLTPLIRGVADNYIGPGVSGVISPVIASQTGMLPFAIITSQKFGVLPLVVQVVSSFIASLACSFFVPSVILAFLFWDQMILPSKLLLDLLDLTVNLSDKYYWGFSLSFFASLTLMTAVFALRFKTSSLARFMRFPVAVLLMISIVFGLFDHITAPEAKVIFIDVGQGDSCLIISSGKSVLVDGGTYEAGKEDVISVLEYYDVRHVDVAVATHWDSDHLGGLLYLYDVGIIDKIYTPCVTNGPKQKGIMEQYLPEEEVCDIFMSIERNDRICISEACMLDVLYPDPEAEHTGENEDSLVMKLDCCGISILLTGDLGIEQEDELVDRDDLGKIDILKAGHHGSEFSTGYGLLSEINPDIAVISAGVNNQYGHPSKATLLRLENYDVKVMSTQDMGAITILIYESRYEIFGFLRNHDLSD